jgi:hypothetical protein
MLDLHTPHRRVRRENGGAVHVLPFRIARRDLEQALLFFVGEHSADRRASRLGQHLYVVFESVPVFESLEDAAQHTDVHVHVMGARVLAPWRPRRRLYLEAVRRDGWPSTGTRLALSDRGTLGGLTQFLTQFGFAGSATSL